MKCTTKNRWISLRRSDLDRLRARVEIDLVVDATLPPKPGALRVVMRLREGCKGYALHVRAADLADLIRRGNPTAPDTATVLLRHYRDM